MQGNLHVQTQLIKALKRDIVQHRRHIQNSLASKLAFEVRKHKAIDDHFVHKKMAIRRAGDATKKMLGEKQSYYVGRGQLAMDMVYSDIHYKLVDLEKEIMEGLEALKRENEQSIDEIKLVEHRMAVRRSACHFFKGLYESEPSVPVGESLEMLRHLDN